MAKQICWMSLTSGLQNSFQRHTDHRVCQPASGCCHFAGLSGMEWFTHSYPFYQMFHLGFSVLEALLSGSIHKVWRRLKTLKTESRTLPSALLPKKVAFVWLPQWHPKQWPVCRNKTGVYGALSVCIMFVICDVWWTIFLPSGELT